MVRAVTFDISIKSLVPVRLKLIRRAAIIIFPSVFPILVVSGDPSNDNRCLKAINKTTKIKTELIMSLINNQVPLINVKLENRVPLKANVSEVSKILAEIENTSPVKKKIAIPTYFKTKPRADVITLRIPSATHPKTPASAAFISIPLL